MNVSRCRFEIAHRVRETVGSSAVESPLEDGDRTSDGSAFGLGHRFEHGGQTPYPAASSFLKELLSFRRRANDERAPVVGAGSRSYEAELLQLLHEAGHARRTDLFGGSERAERSRPSEHENRERGELRSGEPARGIRRAEAAEEVNRERMEPVGKLSSRFPGLRLHPAHGRIIFVSITN